MGFIDLHLHSSYSQDGEYSPKELTDMVLRAGIKVFSIADHNTTQGLKEAACSAEKAGLRFIPAVELDCRYEGTWFHILGYWINPDYDEFQNIENNIIRQEQDNAEAKLECFEKMGLQVDREAIWKLSRNGMVWGELIAEVILNDSRNRDNSLIAPYFLGQPRSGNPLLNFDWDFCSPGQPAYFPINYIDFTEALRVIKKAGGVTVLAHPGRDVKEDRGLLARMAKEGLDGLEAFSSYHSPEQNAFYEKAGQKLGLALTCGSDFHGKTKPSIKIGSVDCGDEKEILRELEKRRR